MEHNIEEIKLVIDLVNNFKPIAGDKHAVYLITSYLELSTEDVIQVIYENQDLFPYMGLKLLEVCFFTAGVGYTMSLFFNGKESIHKYHFCK